MSRKKEVGKEKVEREGKKKIVIATDSYLPRWDGIARFLDDMIPVLKPYFDITIIAPEFEGKKKQIKGITEILMPISMFRFGDYSIPLFKKGLAKKAIKDADLIWTHSIGPIGKNVIKLGNRYKKRIISYIHSIEWELFSRSTGKPFLYHTIAVLSRRYIRKIYSKCDLLMMPSYSTMHLFNWYKIKTKKVLLTLGIDTSRFVPCKSKVEAKKKIKTDPSNIVIGYCGRIAHEKDLKTLIRAFLRIRDIYKNLKLLIVGSGLPELEAKFDKIKGVIYPGAKSGVVPYYQAMDIYVLPSLTETTSLSTLEAMSCGVPVLATPVGEIDKYVKNGKNGYKFSKGNSFELSHYLKQLIDDPKLRGRLGKNARLTVQENYSWELSADRIVSELVKNSQ